MILPSSYLISLIIVIAAMLCWGSWANMFKASGKWRFELFYVDFAVGALVVGLLLALTFGSLGWDGFSFLDDVRISGKRQELYAFLGGAVFNLGNMLFLGAVALGGMSVAFPIGLGVALIVSVAWSSILSPIVNPMLLVAGCVAVLGAVILSAISFKAYRMQRLMAQIQEGKTKSTKKTVSTKAIAIAIVAGVLIGSFSPLLNLARSEENGLGPYSTGAIFAIGIFVTTFVYNLFLMNLPIHGQPVDFGEYFKGRGKQHLLGILAGGLLAAGATASFVAARAEGVAQVPPALVNGVLQAAAALGALWGLLYWKEFRDAEPKVRTFMAAAVVLLVLGIGVVAVAPVYGVR